MEIDIQHLQSWVGNSVRQEDCPGLFPLRALAATLDRRPLTFSPGAAIPPLWHWLYFLPLVPQHELAEDGHARKGGFLPPVPLPRRMWAGSRIEFRRSLLVGQQLERRSSIKSVESKAGRSGNLVFVSVSHEIHDQQGLALSEEQNLVYREASPAGMTPTPLTHEEPEPFDFSRKVTADITLLFRYSALTFNTHRIHYDHDYACNTEGYPGMVVHGPLLATLLMELLLENLPGVSVKTFAFRALHPVFAAEDFLLCGRIKEQQARLWISAGDGRKCMEASASVTKSGSAAS